MDSYDRSNFDTTAFEMPPTQEGRDDLLAEFEAELARLEAEHRDHERSIESRIYMSRKEERARVAMMEWIEEEIDILETKIARIKSST